MNLSLNWLHDFTNTDGISTNKSGYLVYVVDANKA